QQLANFPKLTPFPGELLSKGALLRSSTVCQFDRATTYRQVLGDGTYGGWIDTNPEDAPWVIVQLPGDADLTGIALVDRFEFAPESDWAIPLKVSVSADGKTWTPVANFDKMQPLYAVNLAGKSIRARYVKA